MDQPQLTFRRPGSGQPIVQRVGEATERDEALTVTHGEAESRDRELVAKFEPRISRRDVCCVLGIKKSYLRNKLSNCRSEDPAPKEENGSWAYSEIQPWLVRQFPPKAFLFPADYRDFLEQAKVSTL